MQIFIKIILGKLIGLDVEPTDTIQDIKDKIQEIEGIPVNEQRIFYAGKELENNNTLEDYSVQKDATVHLALPLRRNF